MRISHLPTRRVVSQQDKKSQIKNKAKAMKVLRSQLYEMDLQRQPARQPLLRPEVRQTLLNQAARKVQRKKHRGPKGAELPTCIYCNSEGNSREHWLPRGFGAFRGNTTLANQVCRTCNNLLGRLDGELLRTGHTGFQRALLGIQGRHGASTVSPFEYKAMQAKPPTRLMMPAIGRHHQILAEAYTDVKGTRSARPMRQVVLELPNKSMAPVPFPHDWNAIQLKRAVANRRLEAGILREIYAGENEILTDRDAPHTADVMDLLTLVFGKFEADVYGGDGERTQDRLIMVGSINTKYLRAVAKVAFHYLLWACPILKGNDPVFAEIRAFISHGTGNGLEIVQVNAPQFLPRVKPGYLPKQTSHFFHSVVTSDEATVSVQFFQGPNGGPPPALVRVATKPLMIREAQVSTCHETRYFAADSNEGDGHRGELIAIRSWNDRITTAL